MKITEAKYVKRYNLGDFQHEEMSLVGSLEGSGLTGSEALVQLKNEVEAAHAGEVVSPAPAAKNPKTKQEKPVKKGKKNGESKAAVADDEDGDNEDLESEASGDDGESDQDDEAPDSEDSDSDDSDSEDGEGGEDSEDGESSEEEVEERSPARKPAGSKKEGGKKSFKKKPQPYDRSNETHKELFTGVLRTVSPDWKKSEESKLKAKKVSMQLEGVDFLDESGEVLKSFLDLTKKMMSAKAK